MQIFLLHWKFKKCNNLHFTNVLTVHQKNWNQMYIINGVLSDWYEGYSKVVVA